MSRWPGPQGLVGYVEDILSDGVPSITTEDASITNQTDLRLSLGSNQSYSAADNWDTLEFDTVDNDNLNEWDGTNFQFTPGETGVYFIVGQTRFRVAADGDQIAIRFRNLSSGNVLQDDSNAGGTAVDTVRVVGVKQLTGGATHEFQIRNFDNDDTVEGFSFTTYASIWRVPL